MAWVLSHHIQHYSALKYMQLCIFVDITSMWSKSRKNIKFNLNLIMNSSLFIKFWRCHTCKIIQPQFAILSNIIWINWVKLTILLNYDISIKYSLFASFFRHNGIFEVTCCHQLCIGCERSEARADRRRWKASP